MFIPVRRFIDDLPGILAGKERLDVLFASYRGIGPRPNGPVQTGDKNLTVTVQAGLREYSLESLIAFGIAGSLGLRMMEEESGAAFSAMRQRLPDRNTDPDKPFLAVVYLGLVQFDQALGLVGQLRQQHPDAVIATLTCDCDTRSKGARLEPLVGSEINYSLITEECGGNSPMDAIVRSILANWPQRSRLH